MDPILEALELKFKGLQDQLTEAQDKGASKDEVIKLHEAIEKQGNALEEFNERFKAEKVETVLMQIKGWAEDNIDKINEIQTKGSGSITFTPKAVGAMSTGSGTNIGAASPLLFNNISGINLRDDNGLLALCTTTSTSEPQLYYTEIQPKDGDYAFVAEAGEKPQIDFQWVNRFASPKKVAAHQVMSTEVVQDVERIVSVAREYLLKKHDLFKVNAVYFGTGSGTNPEGATKIGRTFSADGMANKVDNANFMDVVNACITDIYTTTNFTDESPYQVNAVMVNPVDFFINLVSAKDARGLPLYPSAGLFNQVTIGGVTIRPWIKIPSGKIFAADMTRYNIVNRVPFEITMGWIDKQFITNQFTMVGESRFYQYVENFDRQAFLYDDIATIKAAIETP